jgi:phosphate transport system permease protein
LNGTKQQWVVANKIPNQAANQIIELPPVNPAELLGDGEVTIAGSSTVYPLSRGMLKMFRQAGYAGTVKIDQVGSTEGFRSFCKSGGIDIANASRLINRAELEACRQANLGEVMAFQIGNDAIAVVVSQQNQFLENVTVEELRQIFTGAEKWSDVNSAWPAEPITRLIPGANSGTLDFFSETVFNRELSELPADTLIAILEKNLSKGLIRRFESEQPLADRSVDELYELVQNKVLEPQIVKSWQLRESLFNRAEIQAYADTVPNGRLEWQNWLHIGFLTMPQSSVPEFAGVRTALIGTLWTVFITIFVALPVGVGAAIYLEEYASHVRNRHMRRLNTVIQTNINNLAGVPSIIYGMLGLAIFVRLLETFTSGAVFGSVASTTANGRTILSAGMTLALLILPLIIINAQEAIRAVPNSLRQAGMALGATKWQTIWHHVLPAAVPGILTGNILAMSRAIGETAPLVVIGASTFITVDPSGLFSKFTTLPIQIYQWTSRPQDEFRNIAAAAIIVLLILLLFLNATAVVLRNHYTRRI